VVVVVVLVVVVVVVPRTFSHRAALASMMLRALRCSALAMWFLLVASVASHRRGLEPETMQSSSPWFMHQDYNSDDTAMAVEDLKAAPTLEDSELGPRGSEEDVELCQEDVPVYYPELWPRGSEEDVELWPMTEEDVPVYYPEVWPRGSTPAGHDMAAQGIFGDKATFDRTPDKTKRRRRQAMHDSKPDKKNRLFQANHGSNRPGSKPHGLTKRAFPGSDWNMPEENRKRVKV